MKGGESRGRAENPRQEVFAKLLFVRRQASASVPGSGGGGARGGGEVEIAAVVVEKGWRWWL